MFICKRYAKLVHDFQLCIQNAIFPLLPSWLPGLWERVHATCWTEKVNMQVEQFPGYLAHSHKAITSPPVSLRITVSHSDVRFREQGLQNSQCRSPGGLASVAPRPLLLYFSDQQIESNKIWTLNQKRFLFDQRRNTAAQGKNKIKAQTREKENASTN